MRLSRRSTDRKSGRLHSALPPCALAIFVAAPRASPKFESSTLHRWCRCHMAHTRMRRRSAVPPTRRNRSPEVLAVEARAVGINRVLTMWSACTTTATKGCDTRVPWTTQRWRRWPRSARRCLSSKVCDRRTPIHPLAHTVAHVRHQHERKGATRCQILHTHHHSTAQNGSTLSMPSEPTKSRSSSERRGAARQHRSRSSWWKSAWFPRVRSP